MWKSRISNVNITSFPVALGARLPSVKRGREAPGTDNGDSRNSKRNDITSVQDGK